MKVISVKFKESGRAYYFDPKELEIKEGEFVIVETARGVECGEVARTVRTRKPPLNCAKSALPPISCR